MKAIAIRILHHVVWRLRALVHLFLPAHPPTERRITYQRPAIRHVFQPGQRVLDIGSGGDPFPEATVLADRYLEPTVHRADRFRRDGKPVVICDIAALPFRERAFDYVVCSHVLEHVADPIAACGELQRCAGAGFIETPSRMKDMLFAWADGRHRWHVVAIARRLVFFEYSRRELEGVRSPVWRDLILGPVYHPLQTVFSRNEDLFNVLFEWKTGFDVTVLRLDGSTRSLSER